MTSMIASNEIFKRDRLGRVRVPVERREALLAEFEKSGVSGAAFARMVGVKYHTFITWVEKRRQGRELAAALRGNQSSQAVRLIEAVVESAQSERSGVTGAGGLVVELPGGSRIEITTPWQAQMVAELVVLIAQQSGKR